MNQKHYAKIKHGHYVNDRPSPEYYTWRSIKARCFNIKHQSYGKYGGAGITMDPIWKENFAEFLADVGPRPSLYHTLDRKINELGYVPGNVRWATRFTQNRNRSDNHWITANGEKLCLEDWARKIGCTQAAIRYRIKRGWSPEKAVTTPPNKKLQNNNIISPEEKEALPKAFGPNDITIVISNNSTIPIVNIFIGRRHINTIQEVQLMSKKQEIPSIKFKFQKSDIKILTNKINLHAKLINNFPLIQIQ